MLPNEPDAVKVGDKVIVGRHTFKDNGDDISDNWCDEMEQYVGQVATVTRLVGKDLWDCYTVEVDIDIDYYSFRVENMTLATDVVYKDPEDWSRPRVCVQCGDTNHYAPYKANHVCYGCVLWVKKAS
jgi:hypothetical protein